MTGLKMMEAVDGLSDKMILEFADVQPVRQERVGLLHWLLPVAACLCLLLGAAGLYFMNQQDPGPSLEFPPVNSTQSTAQASTQPPATSEMSKFYNVVWAGADEETIVLADFLNELKVNTVTLGPVLQEAFEVYTEPNTLFAVRIQDAYGTESSIVLQKVKENLTMLKEPEGSYLFLTKEQIQSIQCPEGMALWIGLVRKDRVGRITLEVLEQMEQETLSVEVYFNFGNYLYYRNAYREGLFDSLEEMRAARSKEMMGLIEQCVTELGLAMEDITPKTVVVSYGFTAELNKEQIRRLLEEEWQDILFSIWESYGDDFFVDPC